MDINLKGELESMLDESLENGEDCKESNMKKFVWVSVNTIDYPEIRLHFFEGEDLLDAIKNEILDYDSDMEDQLIKVDTIEEYERRFECRIKELSPETYLGEGVYLKDIIKNEWDL